MKKAIFLFFALIVSVTFFFSSCKKDSSSITDGSSPANVSGLKNDGSTPAVATARQTARSEDGPTGIVHVSEDLYNASVEGSLLAARQIGDHEYVAENVRPGPGTGGPQIDPCAQDWINWQNWVNANMPAWQAYANATCTPVYVAWSGRCIACVLMIIKPNSRNCFIRYEATYKAFEAM